MPFRCFKNFFPLSLANCIVLMTTECSSAPSPPYIKIYLPICELPHLVDRLIRWLNYDFWIASLEVINLIFTNILLSTPTIKILYAEDKFVSIYIIRNASLSRATYNLCISVSKNTQIHINSWKNHGWWLLFVLSCPKTMFNDVLTSTALRHRPVWITITILLE